MPRQKITYPVGTHVTFSYSWYGRTHKHDGHECEVVDQRVKRASGRNYYKYRLKCLQCGTEFNAEDSSAVGQHLEEVK